MLLPWCCFVRCKRFLCLDFSLTVIASPSSPCCHIFPPQAPWHCSSLSLHFNCSISQVTISHVLHCHMFEVSGQQRFPVFLRLVCCYIFGRTCVFIVVCLFLPPTSGLKFLVRMFFLSLNAFFTSPSLSVGFCPAAAHATAFLAFHLAGAIAIFSLGASAMI